MAHIKPNELAAWRARAERLADEGRCVECGAEFESGEVEVSPPMMRLLRITLCPKCRDTSKLPPISPIR